MSPRVIASGSAMRNPAVVPIEGAAGAGRQIGSAGKSKARSIGTAGSENASPENPCKAWHGDGAPPRPPPHEEGDENDDPG